jgi:hypothetical protein
VEMSPKAEIGGRGGGFRGGGAWGREAGRETGGKAARTPARDGRPGEAGGALPVERHSRLRYDGGEGGLTTHHSLDGSP